MTGSSGTLVAAHEPRSWIGRLPRSLRSGVVAGSLWWMADPHYVIAWMGYLGRVLWATIFIAIAGQTRAAYRMAKADDGDER